MLPSDLDGPTPPAVGTPNFVVELDPSNNSHLDMFKFHVDFSKTSNSTFTGPTKIAVAAFSPLCGGGNCVPQPGGGSDVLESAADRLMYRLVYRNFGDHTALLVNHSVVAGTSGGVRWYELHNPETTPTVFQSGTFAPDSQYRWMGAIAMDQEQNIAIGYSRSGPASGQFPSLVYAGRVPTDPLGTMESEVVLKAGLGSQSSGHDRWGDYGSLTIDPSDDCTFWFSQEYFKATGQNQGFNWSTAIGSFHFPGCGSGPTFTLGTNPGSVSVQQGSEVPITITVSDLNGFTGSVNLSASGLPTGVTTGFSPNPTATTSTLTFTASASAATGTFPITVTGVSGSITQTTTVNLTVSGNGAVASLTPTSLAWTNVVVTATGPAKNVTLKNTGSATLNISKIAASGDFALATSTKPCGSTLAVGKNCVIKITFNPTQVGVRNGTLTIADNAPDSPQTVSLTGTGIAQATLTPASVTFPATKAGLTATAKVFTLANKQSVALTGISIGTTGDFSVSTTTCSATLLAKSSCKISVTFTPTQTGARTGQLKVNDSAVGSPQTASLNGTGK
jgi:hypothetical protein